MSRTIGLETVMNFLWLTSRGVEFWPVRAQNGIGSGVRRPRLPMSTGTGRAPKMLVLSWGLATPSPKMFGAQLGSGPRLPSSKSAKASAAAMLAASYPQRQQQLGLCWLCKKYGVGGGKAAAQVILLTQPAKSELLLPLLLLPADAFLTSKMATLGLTQWRAAGRASPGTGP